MTNICNICLLERNINEETRTCQECCDNVLIYLDIKEYKKCIACNVEKPVDDFYRASLKNKNIIKYKLKCKVCYNDARRMRVAKLCDAPKKNINEKKCSHCRIVKSLDNFYMNKESPDLYSYRCNDCYKIYRKERLLKLKTNPKLPPISKKCKGCGQEKIISEFAMNRMYNTAYLNKCKKCYNEYKRNNLKKNNNN